MARKKSPKPKDARKLTVSLPRDLRVDLKAYAASRDETVRAVLLRAIKTELGGFYFATRTSTTREAGSGVEPENGPKLMVG